MSGQRSQHQKGELNPGDDQEQEQTQHIRTRLPMEQDRAGVHELDQGRRIEGTRNDDGYPRGERSGVQAQKVLPVRIRLHDVGHAIGEKQKAGDGPVPGSVKVQQHSKKRNKGEQAGAERGDQHVREPEPVLEKPLPMGAASKDRHDAAEPGEGRRDAGESEEDQYGGLGHQGSSAGGSQTSSFHSITNSVTPSESVRTSPTPTATPSFNQR